MDCEMEEIARKRTINKLSQFASSTYFTPFKIWEIREVFPTLHSAPRDI